MKRIILGSGSPRRKELMSGLDIDFEIDTLNDFKENIDPSLEPHEIPVHMSEGKSHGFHRPLAEDELLVTADTVVIIDNHVMGKPHSREEAVGMLETLAGRTHEVVTAVTLRDCRREETFTDSTMVTFAPLDAAAIDYYIDRYKPFDKAGSYGVQEWIGYVAITRIEGSFYNVMGFPVHKVYDAIKRFLR